MTKIILFNGPPGVGKDTIAEAVSRGQFITLSDVLRLPPLKFAAPLKRAVRDLYLNGDQDLFNKYDSPQEKNNAKVEFLGKSCRELQIAISETYFKPLHGEAVFGRLLASEIKHVLSKNTRKPDNIFISDSGFVPEAQVLIDTFGAENIVLVRLYQEGKDFTGDSRSYIELPSPVLTIDIDNPIGELDLTVNKLLNLLDIR